MESPVVRRRGRPRKRRKEEENAVDKLKSGPLLKKQAVEIKPISLLGRYVLKEFDGSGHFLGKVVYYDCGLYRLNYEDGDCEDLESSEIRAILLKDTDFDKDLCQRRKKLDDFVLKKSVNIEDGLRDSSAEPEKGLIGAEASALSELRGGSSVEDNEIAVDSGTDLSDDSSEDSKEGDPGNETETLPFFPELELPSSSGTMGVPEQYVSYLFAVYGFLRSFSIRLFLSPFTLDEFVVSLNCHVSNMLFDAVHVSLMRSLRHHLEMVSEASELASNCLRCSDWSLLDTLTWPVYVVQYITIHGYTKGTEWKGFKDEMLAGEYYSLPVGRKLMILQILCDDVLVSEELRTELEMRKVSEVGISYDGEEIIPPENGPKRVHPRYAKTSACKDRGDLNIVSECGEKKFPGNANPLDYRDPIGNGDMEADGNGDECQLCGMDGTLLCCDGCPSAYHSRCIGVMKTSIPDGPWYCPECKINKVGPPIARGTFLRGAETFGMDPWGRIFMGTCDHLLVLKASINGEFYLRYYYQNDIPKVVEVLSSSMQHSVSYFNICREILQYWNIPESILSASGATGTNITLSTTEEHANISCSFLPFLGKEHHKISMLKANNYRGAITETNNDTPSCLGTPPSTTHNQLSGPESCVNTQMQGHSNLNTRFYQGTRDSVESSGSVNHQAARFELTPKSSVDGSKSIYSICTSVSSHSSSSLHANGTYMPQNFSSQSKEGNQAGSTKFDGTFRYKPLSYINYYMHGDFAASAAAKLATLSSEELQGSGTYLSNNPRKVASVNNSLQAKAFSITASRFFWPCSEKKLIEVPRERCGWCLSCKAPVSSKRGCMLNHAAICATKGSMKILAGLPPVRNGEGNLPSISTYIIYMEESLHGLAIGPFLSASYRKHWCKQVEQITTLSALKPLLLQLEENIRIIAFAADWVKLMDDWYAESSLTQNAACHAGTVHKRGLGGRRNKKQLTIDEAIANSVHDNFVWWQGGKLSKSIFHKVALPHFVVRKAARQGGRWRISGVSYTDGSEIPRRSRQLVWRTAVEMSRTTSELALQVRYLDLHVRWSDLTRPEQSLLEKGVETEASAFRNAVVCDRKIMEDQILYGVAFEGQKHLPSRVVKNVAQKERGLDGKEKYWFSEAHIPLYLIKEFEIMNKAPADEKHLIEFSKPRGRKQLKATRKDIFLYLTCKRDKLDMCCCSVCQLAVVIRNAVKCSSCQGYFHEGCSISSTVSTNRDIEFMIKCKQCYNTKLNAKKEINNESPTSPLLLRGGEPNSVTVNKGPKLKPFSQALTPARPQESRTEMKINNSSSAAKSQRKSCSWGIIWRKKNIENTGIDFRLKNILLRGSDVRTLEPVCHLCRKSYRSDLMYICCDTCKNWYHAEAVELEESKIFDVVGFKCCKCRRIKSPVCPYSDSKGKSQEVKKTRTRTLKQEQSEVYSDSENVYESKECYPPTPILPLEEASIQDSDPLLFSLTSAELITEHNSKMDTEWSAAPGPGLQKLPVRRLVKRDGEEFFSGNEHYSAEISSHFEGRPLHGPEETFQFPCVEDDSALCLHDCALDEVGNVNYEVMDFEPNTYFSVTELLQPDEGGQYNDLDASGDVSNYWENSCTVTEQGVPEYEMATVTDELEPATYREKTLSSCWKCSMSEPTPDLTCEFCGLSIHSQCSPWVESNEVASWKCGSCREWR